ncbi:MAG: VOC family protein [Planctomycetaceae bacterium]
MQQPITPCLWFDSNAEEAVTFYTSLIPNSRIVATTRYCEGAPLPAGTIMTVSFELNGRPFLALNGGPQYHFTPAISLMVPCDDQGEIDRLWDALLDGGEAQQCGWLTDRYGLCWQIVPAILLQLVSGDAARCSRVMQALWSMVKLDIAALQHAADAAQ